MNVRNLYSLQISQAFKISRRKLLEMTAPDFKVVNSNEENRHFE
jgi:hypothetical protein